MLGGGGRETKLGKYILVLVMYINFIDSPHLNSNVKQSHETLL